MILPRPLFRRRRVPYIPQMEAAECGAACLAMLLAYHGHHAPLAEVREACGVSRDGATASGILQAAEGFGLEAQAVRLELSALGDLPLPAILHWNFAHFLVLERLTPEGAILVDPAAGRFHARQADLSRSFTGVALVFSPGDAFEPRAGQGPSLTRYANLMRTWAPSLGQILGASLMLQMVGMLFPVASQILIDRVLVPQQEPWLWGLGLGLGLAVIGRALLTLLRSWVVQAVQAAMDLSLMEQFIDHLLHLPLSFFHQRRPGDLMQRVQSNSAVRNLFSSRSVSALLDGFLLLGYTALMLAYSPALGGLLLLLAGVRIAVLVALRERNQQIMTSEMAASGMETAVVVEILSGMETLRASGAEGVMLQRWAGRAVDRMNQGLARRRLEIASRQAMTLLQGLTFAAVYFVGGRQVLADRMTLGVFAAFLTLQALFMEPLESLVESLGQLQFLTNHLARLDDVMETQAEPTGTQDPGRLQGAIELDQVSFSYGPSAPPAIRGLSVRIRPGEKVALVGPSGAGKSTLARLLLGMHTPSEGAIRFDGMDLRSLDLQKLRNQMGVVLQETFLFNDTVRANLSLNDSDLPMADVQAAAKTACIDGILESLPEGYATNLGDNGKTLSGGQRQRLSLARALSHDPAVLLLDEATSALDFETEAQVHANLAALGCTRIIIAHRLATVVDADRILVLEQGRIVQEGGYGDLAARPGLFRELVQAMEAGHA